MSERRTFLIVGASLAGGRAAEALRQQGFVGRIVLAGAEPDRPYERPPLSKGVIRAAAAPDGAYLQTADFYTEQDIELRLGVRATALDPAAKTVAFDDGATERYDKLLVATGSELRHLALPGSDLTGIHYLRTLADARALAGELARATRVTVVGAGFIGLEVAAGARSLGKEVTLIDHASLPLVRALGPEMGSLVADLHRDRGVTFQSGTGVAEFRGGDRVAEVVTTSGDRVPCDVAVVGVGVTPAVGWLGSSGIAVENGVLVDEFTRTSVPDVFAAGDVANAWNPLLGERVRLEHYDNAQNQGIAAAGAMVGSGEPYEPVPSFWTDQYDLTFQYVGHARGDDQLLIRGDPATRSFTAFYLREGLVRAAFSTRPRDVVAARRLIRGRKLLDPKVLTDEQIDLRSASK